MCTEKELEDARVSGYEDGYEKGLKDGFNNALEDYDGHEDCYDECNCWERGFDDGMEEQRRETEQEKTTIENMSMYDILEQFHKWSINRNTKLTVNYDNALELRDFMAFISDGGL